MTIALVTGASSGIGLELARLLAARGHDLVLVARRGDKLQELAAELGPERVTVVVADLGRPGAVDAIVAAAPRVDVLVNNAGVGGFGPFSESDPAAVQAMIQLNVASLVDLTRRYLPAMVAQGSGGVLNVASSAAFQPGPLMAVYYATKAFVLSFTEAVAEEVRGSGVKVSALCPGPTASGFQAGAAMEDSKLVKGRRLPEAAAVAAAGLKALDRGDVVFVPGLMNKVMASSIRFTPRPLVRRIVHSMQRPEH
jgi:short-subunit dehydrogenase